MNQFKVLFYFLNVISYFLTSNALNAESIIGGDYAKDDQFKYQIYFNFCDDHFCGGAIIAERFVLTAAHCVLSPLYTIYDVPLKIIAGTSDLNTKKGAVEVDVETIYVHEQSDRVRLINDIAILKLKENLHLGKNAHLEKINLPSNDDTDVEKIAAVSDYGFINIETFTNNFNITYEYDGYSDKFLKYAKVKTIGINECQRKVTYFKLKTTNICGYVVQRGSQPEGICSGDSGSPLVNNKTVIGIVSTSPEGCREDKEPAVYTRVSSYVPFIHNIIKGHPMNVKQHTIGANSSCDNRN